MYLEQIEQALPPGIFVMFKQHANHRQYHYATGTDYNPLGAPDTCQMTYFADVNNLEAIEDTVANIIRERLQIPLDAVLLRMKVNITFNHRNAPEHHPAHIDYDLENVVSTILYLNTVDNAQTYIFRDSKGEDVAAIIEAEKNRLIAFDGQTYHASSNKSESTEARFVLNTVFQLRPK